jgi:uncharacterized membrane protein YjfL (UPF0719 family)
MCCSVCIGIAGTITPGIDQSFINTQKHKKSILILVCWLISSVMVLLRVRYINRLTVTSLRHRVILKEASELCDRHGLFFRQQLPL